MTLVATLATASSLPDLRIFLKTLQLWNSVAPPTVYLFADREVATAVPAIGYKGAIQIKEALSGYSGLTRPVMERTPGRYGSLWAQLMAEKISLLEWVFDAEPTATAQGVFFLDADITFFGPLPVPDATKGVALSPHRIRETDEARFGRFNGGFLWLKDPAALVAWRAACEDSRFYEQAALEVLEDRASFFGPQSNYGWWRLWQGRAPAADLAAAWTIRRDSSHSGILVEGAPLLSVHTHWGPGQPADATAFNNFVLGFLKKLAGAHQPAKALLRILEAAK